MEVYPQKRRKIFDTRRKRSRMDYESSQAAATAAPPLHPVVTSQDPQPAAAAPPHQQVVITVEDSQTDAAVDQTVMQLPLLHPTSDPQVPQTPTGAVPQGQTQSREEMAETMTDDDRLRIIAARPLHPVVTSQDPPPAAAAPPHQQVVITVEDSQTDAAVDQTVMQLPVLHPTSDPQVPQTPTGAVPQGQTQSKEQMAETMTDDDRLRIIAARRQPEVNPNPPPVIPFTFSYILWVSCVVLSTFMFVLCNMCNALYLKSSGDHRAVPSSSLPLWGIIDERIRVCDVVRSFSVSFIVVSILCQYIRGRINASNYRFPNNVITLTVYIKGELDIICGIVLSNYLGHHTPAKEDLLIAFAITGGFCLVSSWLALFQLPNHEGLFSILSTVLTSGISYAVSKSKWPVVCLCGICQVLSFALYLPIVLYKRGWVQITFGCVFFTLLLVLFSALPSVATWG